MRLKFKPWAKEYIDNSQYFIHNEEELNQVLLSNDKIRMEFGSGKGKFMYEMAKLNPDIMFIGVEKYESVIVHCGKKLENEPLKNLLFYPIDVFELQNYELLKNRLEVIYLNFSDPWPKKRHEKRRLTSDLFLPLYANLLLPTGYIEFKTDNQGLFEYSLANLTKNNYILTEVNLDLHNTDIPNVKTEYEEKFSNKGFRINKLTAYYKGE